MVYRKRFYRRRRSTFPRRRTFRRKYGFRRKYPKRSLTSRVYTFKRIVTQDIYYTTNISAGIFTFTLNSLPNSSEFTGLFDMYRIKKVTITMRSHSQAAETGTSITGTGKQGGTLYYAVDKTDTTLFSTMAEVQQYQNVRSFQIGNTKQHSISLFPAYQKELYKTVVTSGYGPGYGWVNTADSNLPHYGVKWYWLPVNYDPTNNYSCGAISFTIKYMLQMKNVK